MAARTPHPISNEPLRFAIIDAEEDTWDIAPSGHHPMIREIFIQAVLFCFFAVASATAAIAEQGNAQPTEDEAGAVLVLKLQAKAGISQEVVDSLSGLLAAEVGRWAEGRVISETEVKATVQQMEEKQRCGQGDAGCIMEIGQALGAPEMIVGDIGLVGDFWVLNLSRMDVLKVEVVARQSRRFEQDINAVVRELPAMVAALYGKLDELHAQQEVPPRREEPPPVDMEARRRAADNHETYQYLGWTAVGLGSAGLALGIAGTAMAAKFGRQDSHRAEKLNREWSINMIAGYSVGGALLLTGILLLTLDPYEPEEAAPPVTSFGFMPSRSGFSVLFQGEF